MDTQPTLDCMDFYGGIACQCDFTLHNILSGLWTSYSTDLFIFLFLLIILIIISFISHLANYLFLKVKDGKNMDVSENSGTPKSSILIGFSIINHPNGRIAFQTTMAPGPPVCVARCGGHHRCWVPQMEGQVTKVVVSPVFAPVWVKDFRWFHIMISYDFIILHLKYFKSFFRFVDRKKHVLDFCISSPSLWGPSHPRYEVKIPPRIPNFLTCPNQLPNIS